MSIGGPLALISKVSAKEAKIEIVEKFDSDDKGFHVYSEDEDLAYYCNNKVKKLFKNSREIHLLRRS